MDKLKKLLLVILCLLCFGMSVYAEDDDGDGDLDDPTEEVTDDGEGDVTNPDWTDDDTNSGTNNDTTNSETSTDTTTTTNNGVWKKISDSWVESSKEDKIKYTLDETGKILKVEPSFNDYGVWWVTFTYDETNNKIVFGKGGSFENKKEEAYQAFYIDLVAASMLYSIGKEYDVDINRLDENKLSDYGITLELGDDIVYSHEDSNGSEKITADNITKLEINLTTFEAGTKSLVGTFSESASENSISDVVTNPTVSLSLKKAYSDSLDLMVNIKDLPNGSNAKCDIYMIPQSGTTFSTGSSYVVGTISDCTNGSVYTVKNLKSGGKYAFQVELTYKLESFGFENQVLGNTYYTFSTISSNQVSNPKTGSSIYVIFVGLLFVSLISIFMTDKASKVREY
ncbi:MAG: hypothetical protein VZS44_00175 [Bacilli bacterium]|nr:hypothetical protein [Bacilli bacterium]